MSNPALQNIQACVFDAYGTLFDYASAASRCRDSLGEKFDRLTVLWREKQLQYTWLRAIQGAHADFWQVTGDALDFAMDSLELKTCSCAMGYGDVSRAGNISGSHHDIDTLEGIGM